MLKIFILSWISSLVTVYYICCLLRLAPCSINSCHRWRAYRFVSMSILPPACWVTAVLSAVRRSDASSYISGLYCDARIRPLCRSISNCASSFFDLRDGIKTEISRHSLLCYNRFHTWWIRIRISSVQLPPYLCLDREVRAGKRGVHANFYRRYSLYVSREEVWLFLVYRGMATEDSLFTNRQVGIIVNRAELSRLRLFAYVCRGICNNLQIDYVFSMRRPWIKL